MVRFSKNRGQLAMDWWNKLTTEEKEEYQLSYKDNLGITSVSGDLTDNQIEQIFVLVKNLY